MKEVIISCVQKKHLILFSAGWKEELTKDAEYLELTPSLGGR